MLNLKQLILKLIREFDPAIDLDGGSPFDTDVLEPLLAGLNHDPYATDIAKFIRTRVYQENGVEIRKGSYLEDILVKGLQAILHPYRTEIQHIANRQSVLNYPMLTDADVEGFVANRFVIRDEGEFAQVRVRAYYSNPIDQEVQVDNLARSRTGLLFLPSSPQNITRAQMATQRDGSLYYWDVNFVSAEPGEDYNVEANEIVEIDGLDATRVTNLARAQYGQYRDSNKDLILRAGRANSQATMVSKLGIAHLISKEFSGRLRLILSIGRNDPEMKRDILTASGTHRATLRTYCSMPTVIGASDGEVDYETDAHNLQFTIPATTYTDVFLLADAINNAWIVAGGNSYIVSPWVNGAQSGLDWHSDSVALGATSTLQFLAEPNNAYAHFFLDAGFANTLATVIGTTYTGEYAGVLALDGIPGGIIDPNQINGQIIVPANTLHIGGGAADIHVAPRSVTENIWVDELAEHHSPEPVRSTLDTTSGTDVVEITDNSHWDEVVVGAMIALYSGGDAGLYEVLDKYVDGGDKLRLRAASGGLTATATGVQWAIVNPGTVSVKLFDPFKTLLKADTCSAAATSNLVSHSTFTWASFGVGVGQRLDILTGDNEGSYIITSIVSPNVLQIDQNLPATDTNMTVQVVQPYTPMQMPMREIEAVEEVDATGRPTGTVVPYARPVDIRVLSAFSNLNAGTKSDGSTANITSGSDVVTCADFAASAALNPAVGDRIYIDEGPNKGYYRIVELLTSTTVRIDAEIGTTEVGRVIVYGSPSVGTVRFYFRDATSFEVYGRQLVATLAGNETFARTELQYQPETGGPVYRFEGANFTYRRVPEPDETTYPSTLNRTSASTVESASHDFALLGVKAGDQITITTGVHSGTYLIADVEKGVLTIAGSPFASTFTSETFYIDSLFTQGIQSTTMSQQLSGPFYYFDAEFVSFGAGDAYNLPQGTQLTLSASSNFYEEGWVMETENENLTFSVYEQTSLKFTQNYLEVGMPEQRSNRTLIHGSGFRVRYNLPQLVSDVQNYALNSDNRVVCEDPLIRHLVPVFVYTEFDYAGGSAEAIVRLTLKQDIENLVPEQDLAVYDLVKALRRRGATDVQMPIELVGIRWNKDRTITVFRSEDKLETGRTSCFVVGDGGLDGVVRT